MAARPPATRAAGCAFLAVASLFVLSIFGAQLVRIQGFDATAVAQEAQLKREAAQIIPAMRGQVLSSDGTVLASSVVREVVVADQQAVCTYGTRKNTCDPATSEAAVQQAATELAPLLNTTVSELVPQLTGTSRYRILSRDVTPLTWNTISELGIPGINRDRRETRSQRTYPQGTTTAALVGYMTGDGKPGGGVELMMEKHLEGTPGKQTFEQGRDGTIIPVGETSLVPAVDGNDVTLTINSSLQWYAQNALAQRIKATKAAVRDRRHPGRQERQPARRRLVPLLRPEHRHRQEGRPAEQRGLLRRVRAGVDLEDHDDGRRARGGHGHAVDAGRHPQPAAALRRELQGQPRAPDALPHRRRHPGRVEQHRHHPR